MANPFRSFQYLPWRSLLLSAGLTILIATALDVVLIFALQASPTAGNILLGTPLLSLLASLAAAFGIGALAIVVSLNFFRQIPLRADTMWALVACVLLILLMKSQLRAIPTLFVKGPDYFSLVTIAVGAFTQGRRYWRY